MELEEEWQEQQLLVCRQQPVVAPSLESMVVEWELWVLLRQALQVPTGCLASAWPLPLLLVLLLAWAFLRMLAFCNNNSSCNNSFNSNNSSSFFNSNSFNSSSNFSSNNNISRHNISNINRHNLNNINSNNTNKFNFLTQVIPTTRLPIRSWQRQEPGWQAPIL